MPDEEEIDAVKYNAKVDHYSRTMDEYSFSSDSVRNYDLSYVQILNCKNINSLLPIRKFYISTPFKKKETAQFPVNGEKFVSAFLDIVINKYVDNEDYAKEIRNSVRPNIHTRNYVVRARKWLYSGGEMNHKLLGLKDLHEVCNLSLSELSSSFKEKIG